MLQKLKDLFIPCEENGYKPDFLERMSVGIMLVLVLLSFAVANLQALLWISSDWMVSTILPAVIVERTNDERGDGQLGTLTRSDVLDAAAQLKANDMAKYSYFAHYSPTGVSPWHWFDETGYNYIHAGENLAVHFTDSDEVVKAWMNSPSHKANIMNGNYTEIGVGTAKGEYKGFPTIFVVQLFGTPAQAKLVEAEVAGVASEVTPAQTDTISVEKIAFEENTSSSSVESVAPATIDTATETVIEDEVLTTTIPEEEEPIVATTSVMENSETEPVVLYSDLATSSRAGVPVMTTGNTTTEDTSKANVFGRIGTESSLVLQIVYVALASLVLVALILSIVIEWRRQNPVQIAYAGGLLVIMAFLFHVHTMLSSGVSII